ncbi:hypothetical protein immuto35A_211 [Flavobacterium phage vB_FspM_immuto_3-5A]|uniref:Uncharacterized protein n=1 Tax=Flavobacterium phage vB_FspM_immuto_2-6A TaxID=2801477 RepID=A0A7T8IWT3_9CAUD|nr:hypothetical protein KNV73_gp059 [Flavobacterium phage vB_FspM_immuto_2-6A]QQO91891.1 hypothetical protein immuto26A_212 [Flavobacterium phage vB_FspM_immuto_2-6A]QQO92129.1 hypothetical protein immuto35A_211 [Flavobacterium phage vB_FspM_immuto_3-5A]QQO92367.1 hypothetical protein immuto136C_211 [Flavobacterium phage vB_FspM_immuto_13-6C]
MSSILFPELLRICLFEFLPKTFCNKELLVLLHLIITLCLSL